MKKTASVTGVILFFLSVSAGTGGEGKVPVRTILDTLNSGREVSLTSEDFFTASQAVHSAQPSAVKIPAEAVSGVKAAKPEYEAGVVPSRFKVQIIAGTQEREVKKVKKVLARKTDLPLSISFVAPYYKLFAGDFSHRSEAEAWCVRFKDMGYSDAWIVRTAAVRK